MGMLEMIPREFWLDLYRELLRVAHKLMREERDENLRKEAERTKRICSQYDEAIRNRRRSLASKATQRRKGKI